MMNTSNWIETAFIYHIYPLGLTSAPYKNQYNQPVEYRLEQMYPWLDHLQWLGVNTILMGPILQSMSHGYDLVDYFKIDQRLGDNHSFQKFSQEVHRRGMRIILDAVFNHSGRDFFAFQDILKNKQNSLFQHWYDGVRFDQSSPMGDPFTYNTWDGHFRLPKFNLSNPDVRDYLYKAVQYWYQEWNIDGLRLDAADVVQMDFMKELRQITTSLKNDFWLMGEVVHGQYQNWANPNYLHSVTNYEAYKGLYSSLNDKNYHEIAYSLQRQFGNDGIYKDLMLYNFVDNHDVNRIISQLEDKKQIYLLYTLLFTIPGVPSIYYGSEWGIQGIRDAKSDKALRPAIDLNQMIQHAPEYALPEFIKNMASFRQNNVAIRIGTYRQEFVNSQQFGFWRETDQQKVLIMLNASSEPFHVSKMKIPNQSNYIKHFDPNLKISIENQLFSTEIPPYGMVIIVFES